MKLQSTSKNYCVLNQPLIIIPDLHCDDLLLVVPFTRRKTFRDRSFSFIAPKLWNTLPYELRASDTCKVFKRNLKTHLFRLSFN